MNKINRMMWQLVLVTGLLAGAAGAARVEGGTPIVVEPDGVAPVPYTAVESADEDEPPVPPAATAYLDATFDAGTYVALCFIPDPATGQDHASLGMVQEFILPESGIRPRLFKRE